MKTFVVSMKKSADRRAHMTQLLGKLGVGFEFWDATDGRALSAGDIEKCVDIPALKRWSKHGDVRPGEIGCAISHWRLWRHIVDHNLSAALVFEDDIEIHRQDILELVRRTLAHLGDREIALLQSGQSSTWAFQRVRIGADESLVYANGKANCTAAYLITHSAASALCADLDANRIRFPIDAWCHQSRPSFSGIIKTRLLIPNPITQNHSKFASTVQVEKMSAGARLKRPLAILRERLNVVRDLLRSPIPPRPLLSMDKIRPSRSI